MIDRMNYLRLWQGAQIRGEYLAELEHIASLIMNLKPTYDRVEEATTFPWYAVGALDCREEDFNHGGYLGNGDPLWRKTTHVPEGRGPFKTWYEGAIDALQLDGMDKSPNGHWDIVTVLIKCEGYNGWGYERRGIPSPYVWALTNQQRAGKFVSDGNFDASVWDRQPGVAAIFLALKQFHNVDLREA